MRGKLGRLADSTDLSQGEWISLLGLAFGATVLAYAWYFDGVKHLGAGNASAYIILVPIFRHFIFSRLVE